MKQPSPLLHSGNVVTFGAALFFIPFASTMAAPGNDGFSSRLPVSGASLTLGIPGLEDATVEPGEPPLPPPFVPQNSVWYEWVAPSDGWYRFDSTGSTDGASVSVYFTDGASLSGLREVAVDAVAAGIASRTIPTAGGGRFVIRFDADAADATDQYVFNIQPSSGPEDPGDFNLVGTGTAWNDAFADRIVLGEDDPAAVFYDRSSTREPSEPGTDRGGTVWFEWPATRSGDVDVALQAFDGDGNHAGRPALAVWEGDRLADLALVAEGTAGSGNGRVDLSFPAASGTAYQIAVHRNEGGYSSGILALDEPEGSSPGFSRPEGWHWTEGEWEWSHGDAFWYWIPLGPPAIRNTATGQVVPRPINGWNYYDWPYFYSAGRGVWYYIFQDNLPHVYHPTLDQWRLWGE